VGLWLGLSLCLHLHLCVMSLYVVSLRVGLSLLLSLSLLSLSLLSLSLLSLGLLSLGLLSLSLLLGLGLRMGLLQSLSLLSLSLMLGLNKPSLVELHLLKLIHLPLSMTLTLSMLLHRMWSGSQLRCASLLPGLCRGRRRLR
jgi:deleted-in-malignant-brain-tumors protein 1